MHACVHIHVLRGCAFGAAEGGQRFEFCVQVLQHVWVEGDLLDGDGVEWAAVWLALLSVQVRGIVSHFLPWGLEGRDSLHTDGKSMSQLNQSRQHFIQVIIYNITIYIICIIITLSINCFRKLHCTKMSSPSQAT